jgi:thiol-disulfide isomerase/thioredoxin
MKKSNFSWVFFFVFTVSFAQKQEIKLPLTFHNELSIHSDEWSSLDHTKVLSDTLGIAKTCKSLTNLKTGRIRIYDEAIFTGWDRSFRSSVKFVFGTDKNGKDQLIIDKNNNSDFSDDIFFVADTIGIKPKVSMDQLSKVSVEYDWAEQGKKVKRFTDVHIVYNSQQKLFFFTFAQHASAILNKIKLEIVPQRDLSYMNFEVFYDSSSATEAITSNKYLKDNDKLYRVKDLDIDGNVLILEKEKIPFSKIESPQIGFRAPAFSAIDLIAKDTVSLEKYKGKYVFLDLWTTWCGPCLAEMPKIKKIYDEIDHSKIEFIGIVGKDKPERINNIINNIGINWKLVEANSDNYIFNKYKVRSFPTTLLIDPNGIVIKSNFRAEELKKFIENDFKDTAEK